MQRTAVLRGIAVLALLASGACESAQVPTVPESVAARPVAGIAPSLTVTNSSGYPLLSWNAVAGAVSYKVDLLVYRPQYSYTGWRYARFFTNLSTTTATSYLDTAHSYTGEHLCPADEDGRPGIFYEYGITTTFSDGTTTLSRHFAPIALLGETC